MDSPIRKMLKLKDYLRHKLFRKMKRLRKARAEQEQKIAEKELKRKLRRPKFDKGHDDPYNYVGTVSEMRGQYNPFTVGATVDSFIYNGGVALPEITVMPKENYIFNPYDNIILHYNSGKDIHIKPSKRGTFTAAAKKHGMGVQAYARKVLKAPKGKYSAAMRRKANFARNASKWAH